MSNAFNDFNCHAWRRISVKFDKTLIVLRTIINYLNYIFYDILFPKWTKDRQS